MGWTQLRPIQVEAILAIVESDRDLIISANTGAGKTEAAFLPILSGMVDATGVGVKALYVSPLKALINDQFRRLEDLCRRVAIPVHRWHGDVTGAKRKALLRKPAGVLLITPESIESLFLNYSGKLAKLFGGLRFVVIDEMHAFMGMCRGMHARSLISRVAGKTQDALRLVGLSATVGSIDAAKAWIRPSEPACVAVIRDEEAALTVRYIIKGYRQQPSRGLPGAFANHEAISTDHRMAEDIFRAFHGKTGLVFAGTRSNAEQFGDMVKRLARCRGMPDRFRVHHGSLSKAERETTEDALRNREGTTTFCTSTLELGIDVGNVSEVGHLGAPWSVNALLQRLGRSGRKEGQPCVMRQFIRVDEPGPSTPLRDRLAPTLIRAIALTELMRQHWCEPPDEALLYLSPLVQQIVSVIVERGGAMVPDLFETLVIRGSFGHVDPDLFQAVIDDMRQADLLERSPEDCLILGQAGERLARSMDIYAVFSTPQEYVVRHGGNTIGSINPDREFAEGTSRYVILAGRRWGIVHVNHRRKEIAVTPSDGGRVPEFLPKGCPILHRRVCEMMRDVLRSDEAYPYLDATALAILASARTDFREAGLAEKSFLADGCNTIWFPWMGSRIHQTLAALVGHLLGRETGNNDLEVFFPGLPVEEVQAALLRILDAGGDLDARALVAEPRGLEKFEVYLSDALKRRACAARELDLAGALEVIRAELAR